MMETIIIFAKSDGYGRSQLMTYLSFQFITKSIILMKNKTFEESLCDYENNCLVIPPLRKLEDQIIVCNYGTEQNGLSKVQINSAIMLAKYYSTNPMNPSNDNL